MPENVFSGTKLYPSAFPWFSSKRKNSYVQLFRDFSFQKQLPQPHDESIDVAEILSKR